MITTRTVTTLAVWVAASGLTIAQPNDSVGDRAGREGAPTAVRIVNVDGPGAEDRVRAMSDVFAGRNPGYAISYAPGANVIEAIADSRIAFVQEGECATRLRTGSGTVESDVWVGDMILLRPGDRLEADAALALLIFTTPEPLPADLPGYIRPDWDEHITDTPGGCATETGAYRRVCLTWLREKGVYNYHGLNAHRVRIMDSFSHYHPVEGGFDEFYLVQMVQPGARIIVSDRVSEIESPDGVSSSDAGSLLEAHDLRVGDLVYLPRGVVHRGLGGVLAHVITVPGFRPGAEIGVDHHLRAINERLGLEGERALPFHAEASAGPVVR